MKRALTRPAFAVEGLEPRALLTTLNVTDPFLADTAPGSLAGEIAVAKPGDLVNIQTPLLAANYPATIKITTPNLTIEGNGARLNYLGGELFDNQAQGTFIQDFTMMLLGPLGKPSMVNEGGGSLTLNNLNILRSHTLESTSGSLSLNNCTLANVYGDAIDAIGSLAVSNTSIVDNQGGINVSLPDGASFSFIDSQIAATTAAPAIAILGTGATATVDIENSAISGSITALDCEGGIASFYALHPKLQGNLTINITGSITIIW